MLFCQLYPLHTSLMIFQRLFMICVRQESSVTMSIMFFVNLVAAQVITSINDASYMDELPFLSVQQQNWFEIAIVWFDKFCETSSNLRCEVWGNSILTFTFTWHDNQVYYVYRNATTSVFTCCSNRKVFLGNLQLEHILFYFHNLFQLLFELRKKSSLVTRALTAKSFTRETDSLHSCTRLLCMRWCVCLTRARF